LQLHYFDAELLTRDGPALGADEATLNCTPDAL